MARAENPNFAVYELREGVKRVHSVHPSLAHALRSQGEKSVVGAIVGRLDPKEYHLRRSPHESGQDVFVSMTEGKPSGIDFTRKKSPIDDYNWMD